MAVSPQLSAGDQGGYVEFVKTLRVPDYSPFSGASHLAQVGSVNNERRPIQVGMLFLTGTPTPAIMGALEGDCALG